MLTSAECRLKAGAAAANAAAAPNAAIRTQWESTAREWDALAITAGVQEGLEGKALGREPI